LNNPGDSGGAGGRTILFVHGRDFKPRADDFMDLSVAALAAGIDRDHPELVEQFNELEKRLAYYGDISNEFLTSQGIRYDEALDIGDRRNALTHLKAITKKKNFGVNRYDRLPGKTALGEFTADVFGPLLGRLGFSKRLINKVGIDIGEYWKDKSGLALAIRERVRATILEALDADNQVLLISHGTGCIVTYDVLWQLSHEEPGVDQCEGRKVDLWLTLGAPLGDSMVRKRLLGASRKGAERYPWNVVSWHNVAAEDDFMSHDNTLVDDYKPMLRQKQVSCIRDYHIYNLAVRYGRSNPHSSLGYLIHPKTVQIVSEWLQQGPPELLPKSIF